MSDFNLLGYMVVNNIKLIKKIKQYDAIILLLFSIVFLI